jgi:hypothetical protein
LEGSILLDFEVSSSISGLAEDAIVIPVDKAGLEMERKADWREMRLSVAMHLGRVKANRRLGGCCATI